MNKRISLMLTSTALAGVLSLAAHGAHAQELNIVSWGGITNEANDAAYWKPFEKKTGIKVNSDSFSGEIGKIRAQVESGNIQWDVAEPEYAEEAVGCMEGLYEKIDASRLPQGEIPDRYVTECGITAALYGTILTYNHKKYGDDGPKTWQDFWDVKKFPGKRGLPKNVKLAPVFALLADGVDPSKIYEVLGTDEGQQRAFDKLDEIKDQIIWWSSGTQQVQGFISGEYDMAAVWNGRAADANKTQGQQLELVWDAGWVSDGNRWVILKGSPNYEAAMDYLAFATQAEHQADYMRNIDYGVANEKAYAMLTPEQLKYMPGSEEHKPSEIVEDTMFWLDHLDSMTERFNNWVSK